MSSSIRIVFMGTPEFAVSSLDALVKEEYEIVGVITAPDKVAGRGQLIQESAVKKYAIDKGLKLLQPTNLKDPKFLENLAALKADIQIVVAFRMLPESVWNMPVGGTINLHASLLPNYRGAAPINWAIMNGDSETGLTTFFIEKEIDTGKVLLQEKIKIPDTWSAGDLHDDLMLKGGALIIKTIAAIYAKEQEAIEQSNMGYDLEKTLSAPKIFKEDCRIDWHSSAKTIYNHIRGLSPYPSAWSELVAPDGQSYSIKIYQTEKKTDLNGDAGAISTDGKKDWVVNCGNGSLSLVEIQLAGKKRMKVIDFLRGFKLDNNWTLK